MGIATLTQYLPQTVAALTIRRNRPDSALPFRMWMYPVPAWVALAGWLFVLLSNERGIILIAVAIAASGIGTYFLRASKHRSWPFPTPCGTGSEGTKMH